MAPKKTPKDENPNALVLSYLCEQNRPYSATEISSNLHNKVTKTKADKALKEMHEKGLIGGKISGKASAYWCLQDPKDSFSPEELKVFDDAITVIRDRLPTLKADLKARSLHLATLRSAPTTEALREAVQRLEVQKTEVGDRLKVLRLGDVKPVTKEQRDKTEEEYRYWLKRMEGRKRIFRDLEGLLLDTSDMKKKELWDKLCIEDDP